MNLDDLIAAERTAPAKATQAQSSEVWRSIERSFVAVVPTAGVPLGAAKASTLGKIGGALSSTAGKIVLATTLVTGGVVGANSVVDRDSDAALPTAPAVAATAPAIPRTPSSPPEAAPSPTPEESPLQVPAPVMQPPQAAPVQQAQPEPQAMREARPAKARPAPKPKVTVQDELALIRRTQAAVRSGAHDRALSLTRRHAATYPDGAFVEDREALRTLALCESDDAKATDAASKFLERWPESMHRSRIEAACD